MYEYFKTVCGDVHVTKGDFDENNKYPEEEVRQLRGALVATSSGATVAVLEVSSIVGHRY